MGENPAQISVGNVKGWPNMLSLSVGQAANRPKGKFTFEVDSKNLRQLACVPQTERAGS
jgi:hypothetical protein